MQPRQVAHRSGVSLAAVYRLLARNVRSGRVQRVRAETAQRLLEVPRPMLDATGTRRRLQALVAIGWPPPVLDRQLGERPGCVERLLRLAEVSDSTAGQVAWLFERLWDCPPPQGTEAQRLAADEARSRARKNGWGPPMAWDEELNPIDDPSAVADIGRPARRGKLPPADELVFLLEAGESVGSIAFRFGVKPATVRQALRRGRRPQDQAEPEAPGEAAAAATAAA